MEMNEKWFLISLNDRERERDKDRKWEDFLIKNQKSTVQRQRQRDGFVLNNAGAKREREKKRGDSWRDREWIKMWKHRRSPGVALLFTNT